MTKNKEGARQETLVDPRVHLRSAPPSSPLWALADAFDAAANGMENPEAAERLALAEEDAFRPWQALVRALRALYAQDPSAVQDALDRMPDASPPAVLKPLFRAWASEAGAAELSGAHPAAAALYRRVFDGEHPILLAAEQAEEALRQGMGARFDSGAARVLSQLRDAGRGDGPLLALRWALRCLRLVEEEEAEGPDFRTTLLSVLGKRDGLLALGLHSLERNEREALAAFRAALACGEDGGFLDADGEAVLRAAADILAEDGAAPKGRAGTGARAPLRREAPAGQLDLFGEAG